MGSSEAGEPPLLRRSRSSLLLKTETGREREALRHLHSWTELYKPAYIRRNAFPYNQPMPVPAACHDTALAAFAQLAALRLSVRRAFITILSSSTEYVLVEATRTMSLQSDIVADPKDESWLGTSSFARSDGINDLSLDGWRKARRLREIVQDEDHYYTEGATEHWHIISDIHTRSDLAQRPYVQRARSPRFYFAIPLRDSEGTVIGSLSILDDKPRYGVSAHDMSFCEDLGDTIALHLQSSLIRSQRQRSERLIQALGTFNGGGSSLRSWWTKQNAHSTKRGGRHLNRKTDNEESNSRFDEEFGLEGQLPPRVFSTARAGQYRKVPRSTSEGNSQASNERILQGVLTADFSTQSGSRGSSTASATNAIDETIPEDQAVSQTAVTKDRAGQREYDLSREVKQAHSRASKLLREALGASGVAFIDASAVSTTRGLNRRRSSTPSDDNFRSGTSDTDASDGSTTSSRMCEVMAISTHMEVGDGRAPPFELSHRDLTALIKAYPRAKVFSFMKDGDAYSGSDASDTGGSSDSTFDASAPRVETKHSRHAQILMKAVGKAVSIAFYPIFDESRELYRSCLIVWTKANNAPRFFDPAEDVTYLSAFAHSLRAELARLETTASDAAKGAFISGISHELRSPLHGVLAGVELLQDSKLTPFQHEMALSVALAGRTLLDTVDHILDYSKISNLSRGQKRDRAKVDSLRHHSAEGIHGNGLASVDLARLTEEVVESAISAHRHLRRPTSETSSSQHAVSVTLDIEKRDSWTTAMMPGTWVRILNNILGNALKYTPEGVVSVKLFTSSDENQVTHVNLQIQDTGIGMTQEFVRTEMWHPFKQADTHSPGTGLGLSIVKEVAKDLDATISAKSELGKGTSITIRFLANFHHLTTPTPDPQERRLESFAGKPPRHFHMVKSQEDITDANGELGTRAVAESVARTAENWLGFKALFSDGPTSHPAHTVCAVFERDLLLLYDKDPQLADTLLSRLATEGTQILIIAQSVASSQPDFDFERFELRPLYVYQPIGPRKLLRVISDVQDSIVTRQPGDYFTHTPIPITPRPRMIRGDSDRPQSPEVAMKFAAHIRPADVELSRDQIKLPFTPKSTAVRPLRIIQETGGASREEEIPSDSPLRRVPDRTLDLSIKRDRPPGHTVLLVEDNDINMRLLLALMGKLGLDCECAVNGLEALQKYRVAPSAYFLVLMDMNMPIMDGFEATEQIRAVERSLKSRNVHIAALTGVTSSEARARASNAGVDEYITKPIRMKDLTAIIDGVRNGMSET